MLRKFLLICLILLILFSINSNIAFASENNESIINEIIPNEEVLGIKFKGDYVPEFRQEFNYSWDTGYDLIEWDVVPKINEIFPVLTNYILSIGLAFSHFIMVIAITILEAAFHTNFLKEILIYIKDYTLNLNSELSEVIALFILITIGWLVYQGLIKMRITNVIKGIFATACILAVSTAYYMNLEAVINNITYTTDNMASAITLIAVPKDQINIPTEDTKDAGIISFSNTAWNNIIKTPWLLGQFGVKDEKLIKVTSEEALKIEKELNKKITPGTNWSSVLFEVNSVDRAIISKILADPQIDHGEHHQTVKLLSGSGFWTRLVIFIFSFITAVVFLWISFIIGGTMLMAQGLLVLILTAAGFILVFALIPETGWRLFIGMIKTFAGALLIKVFYGAYLGIILSVCTALFQANLPTGIVLILMSLVFIVAIRYKDRALSFVFKETKVTNPYEVAGVIRTEVAASLIDLKKYVKRNSRDKSEQ